MKELDEGQRAHLARYFASRAQGEWTTAIAFEHILDDLQHFAGTNRFIEQAASARRDERRHAEICMGFVARYSDGDVPKLRPRGTNPVEFPEASASDQRLLRIVFACCFGESIAVQWLLDAHEECRDPKSRKYNRDHLADEVRHSRLGWQFLASGLFNKRNKEMLSAHVPLMEAWSRRLWKEDAEEEDPTLAIYGCPAPKSAPEAVDKALRDVIFPGLELNGVKAP